MANDIELEMSERLVEIKSHIRKAQLLTNLYELDGTDLEVTGLKIEGELALGLIASKDVPPIERMVKETKEVWRTLHKGTEGAEAMHEHGVWLVGSTFAMIAAIDFLLEVD